MCLHRVSDLLWVGGHCTCAIPARESADPLWSVFLSVHWGIQGWRHTSSECKCERPQDQPSPPGYHLLLSPVSLGSRLTSPNGGQKWLVPPAWSKISGLAILPEEACGDLLGHQGSKHTPLLPVTVI